MKTLDIDHLKQWVGRKQRLSDNLSPFPVRALAAVLNKAYLPEQGDPLPPSWHWLYFLETPSSAGTDVDGHPHRGAFLPPVPLPRRMWAAGLVDIVKPLRLGIATEKLSTLRSIEVKTGKTGVLVFVTVDHDILQEGQLCIQEEQTLVYREMPNGPGLQTQREPAPPDAAWAKPFEPDPVLLFRYSALTYNSHRIHYDRDYATRQESYPGLVVHAPLLATLLLDSGLEENPDARLTQFKFRAVRPAFDSSRIDLCGKRVGNNLGLWSVDENQCLGMSMTALLGNA